MPLLSVIIPVYKVEKYLHKCVNSVLEQKFKDIEVILVNDGSPDDCPQICDEFARKDARITVIHQVNRGLSAARNEGIKLALGEYLLFLDSDDYWEGNEALKNIVQKIHDKKFDVLAYSCKDFSCITGKYTAKENQYNNQFIENSPKATVLNYLFLNGIFPGSAWTTVTRRDFIIKNDLFFIEGIKAEDIDWLLNVYLRANVFSSTNDTFYVYLKHRNDSITGTADIKSIKDVLFTIDKWEGKLNSSDYSIYKDDVFTYLSYHYFITLLIYSSLPKEQKVRAKVLLSKKKYLLEYSTSIKVFCVSVALKFLGIDVIAKILSLYYNTKKAM